MTGHTFLPSLQDISLKRFRLRYSVVSDCYYLHWDQAVCPQLARVEGLAKGAAAVTGVTRYTDQEGKTAYLGLSDGVRSAEVQWKLDFSHSGLAVKTMTLKATSNVKDGGIVTCRVTGDDVTSSSNVFSDLGGQAIEVPHMSGKMVVMISAHLWRTSEWSTPHLLPEMGSGHCPLDVIIELMVVHDNRLSFVGDLLLGLKFSSPQIEGGSDWDCTQDSAGPHGGQLHVHVVEGAGLVDMETHKPFNACVKCAILPAQDHSSTAQTSPRHNAYPTWSKELVFPGLDMASLRAGGLEVILTDHHFFHSDVIAGIRLSIPQKKHTSPSEIYADGGSCFSSPSSPSSPTTFQAKPTDSTSTRHISALSQLRGEWLLTPPDSPNAGRVGLGKRSPQVFPMMSPSSPLASPKCSPKFSPFSSKTTSSPKASPRSPKTFQDTPRPATVYQDSPMSPQGSPRPPRIHSGLFSKWTSRNSLSPYADTDYLHWWMDSAGTEVQHWQDVLDREGEWVYCWHTLRPKLQPAASS